MKSLLLLVLICIVTVSNLSASQITDSHKEQQKFTFDSPKLLTEQFSQVSAVVQNSSLNFYDASFHQPIIIINYLGAGCTHCVAQLNEFKKQTDNFKKLNAKIVAISPDSEEKSHNFFSKKQFNQNIFNHCSDPNWDLASKLSLVGTSNKEETLLHGIQVLYKGKLVFGVKGETPFMGVTTVLDKLAEVMDVKSEIVVQPSNSDKWSVTTVLTEIDGILRPLDVEFNSSLFNENDLWIVNSANNGHHTIAIAHNVGLQGQSIVQKADNARSHFMWRTQALAFGTNGTFATAQNGQVGSFLGNDYNEYLFMGPTLWSSDTAIFASRNQNNSQYLGSHLDMLHQSPYNLGIAHEAGSKYWVSDARYNDICSYDFQNPHEVGGTDHRDGIIYRYKDVTITPGQFGIPSHLVKDKTSNWLYFIDGGAKQVKRLDITSGTEGETLEMPNFSSERVQSFKSMNGGIVETVVPTSTATPVGIDYRDGILYVSYYETGEIKLFSVENDFEEIETISTNSPGIMGINVNKLGDIWAANHDSSSVLKISRKEPLDFQFNQNVKKVVKNEHFDYNYSIFNSKSTFDTVYFTLKSNKPNNDWEVLNLDSMIIPNKSTFVKNISIKTSDKPDVITYTITATSKDKQRTAHKSFNVVSIDAERYYVNDAPMETFEVQQQLKEIGKENYIEISSSLFAQNFKSFLNLKTVVWNSGTFGDLNSVDKAVINDLIAANVDVMLIADDPINTMHLDEENSSFLSVFGAEYTALDTNSENINKRTYTIEPNSEVFTFGAINEFDVELFLLNHNKARVIVNVGGGVIQLNLGFIPTPLFTANAPWAKPIMKEEKSSLATSIMGERSNLRTILLGCNLNSFVDKTLRNEILSKSILWLEGGSAPTSVQEVSSQSNIVSLLQNPMPDNTYIRISPPKELTNVKVRLYNSTGALVANIAEYQRINSEQMLPFSSRNLANGVYYIVTDWNGGSTLVVAVKQQ